MTPTPTPPRVVMQATALVKRYGQVVALDGSDFELRAGEILAVIGDNGAGKSSLIKALSGATVPDSGEIRLDGVVTKFRQRTGPNPWTFSRYIACRCPLAPTTGLWNVIDSSTMGCHPG